MPRSVTFKGNPLTLVGRALQVGAAAPDCRVTAQDLKEVMLVDFKGKIKVITSFPSLDTPVCDLQVKEFNKRAAAVSSDAVILGISKDLPFAQKRFCESFDIHNILVFSDYKTSSFGINYGLLVKELNLLARAAVIVDKNDVVRYIQVAGELTASLNYEEILRKLEEVSRLPQAAELPGQASHKCKPCEGVVLPLPKEQTDLLIAGHRGWEFIEGKKIVKEFKFKDFAEAKYFLDLVSVIAEEQGHHPTLTLIYDKLRITLTTHVSGGLTENDFIMAGIIDGLM